MRETIHISVLNRRSFLISAAAAACLAPLNRTWAEDAASANLERSKQFEDAFATLTAGAKPAEGGMTLDLPEIAENGNFVPVIIDINSPMTDADHVKKVHVLSTANPVAKIATFHLSPLNGTARIQSRIRLAKTQDVIVLAEMSTGTLAMLTQTVKVTIGGCQS